MEENERKECDSNQPRSLQSKTLEATEDHDEVQTPGQQ